MEMELPGKEEKRETKKKFFRCSERYGKVGVKETDVEDRKVWRMMIRCGHP